MFKKRKNEKQKSKLTEDEEQALTSEERDENEFQQQLENYKKQCEIQERKYGKYCGVSTSDKNAGRSLDDTIQDWRIAVRERELSHEGITLEVYPSDD